MPITNKLYKTKQDMNLEKENYPIEISYLDGVRSFVAELREKGYQASFDNDWPRDNEDCQSIWVGSYIPASIAIDVIEIALGFFPFLCYLQLSGDHNESVPNSFKKELYIGGMTGTSIERGLKKWTSEDFEKLDTTMTTEVFHALVRSKY